LKLPRTRSICEYSSQIMSAFKHPSLVREPRGSTPDT
jgi:hypothetical protein